MQKLWCWRCKMEVGMLNREQSVIAGQLYSKGMKTKGKTKLERFKDLLDYYFQVTGEIETEPNAVMHHQIDIYGPSCENCNKPYRTPRANFCAACGNIRDHN